MHRNDNFNFEELIYIFLILKNKQNLKLKPWYSDIYTQI